MSVSLLVCWVVLSSLACMLACLLLCSGLFIPIVRELRGSKLVFQSWNIPNGRRCVPLFVYANGRKKKKGGQGNGKTKGSLFCCCCCYWKALPSAHETKKRKIPGLSQLFVMLWLLFSHSCAGILMRTQNNALENRPGLAGKGLPFLVHFFEISFLSKQG